MSLPAIPGLDVAKAAIAPYLLAIKIGVAVLLLIAAGVTWWRVSVWHDAYRTLEATEKALETRTEKLNQCTARAKAAAQAYLAAAGKAESVAAKDRATAQEIERGLQTKLASADASGRDLARRLRDYQRTRAGCGTLPATTGPATEPAPASQEPGLDAEIGRASEQVYADCKSDAVELDGWREWWGRVSAGR